MDWKLFLPLVFAVALAAFVVFFAGPVVPPPAASPSTASVAQTPAATTTSATSATVPAVSVLNPAAVAAQNLTRAGANLLSSVVNILCTPSRGNTVSGASGSGVIIDSRGIIATAAHIGQYFLLADYPRTGSMSCIIRTGGPAHDAYTAKLIYLSPTWLAQNPDTLIEKAPKGTGEDDFAFLAITGSATNAPLPASFPYVPFGTDIPKTGERLGIGGYAAQYLDNATVKADLYPTITFDTVSDRYTFDTSTVDVLAITGTAAAQEGSSGGGLVDANDELVGIITTSSVKGDISSHVLNAITTRHIRATFLEEAGEKLDTYLASRDLPTLVKDFSSEFSTLRAELVKDITGR
jgi:hypothetical protein